MDRRSSYPVNGQEKYLVTVIPVLSRDQKRFGPRIVQSR
jgi:hypothetical protein